MEVFKAIKGYEGIYEISSFGRVKRIQKGKGTNNSKYLKPNLGNNGYLSILLRNKGNDKKFTIHRLIAVHFLPNPHNLPVVDHIDRNRTNNNLTNLRWASLTENAANKERSNGCICQDKRIIKGVEYKYWRVFWYPEAYVRKSRRFKTEEEAKEFIKLDNIAKENYA
jgi:hypothetical protein